MISASNPARRTGKGNNGELQMHEVHRVRRNSFEIIEARPLRRRAAANRCDARIWRGRAQLRGIQFSFLLPLLQAFFPFLSVIFITVGRTLHPLLRVSKPCGFTTGQHRLKSLPLLESKVRSSHFIHSGDVVGLALDADPAFGKHVGIVADRQREMHILFHQDDGEPLFPQAAQG